MVISGGGSRRVHLLGGVAQYLMEEMNQTTICFWVNFYGSMCLITKVIWHAIQKNREN